eukprot:3468072-Prymnesium_polylepis.1
MSAAPFLQEPATYYAVAIAFRLRDSAFASVCRSGSRATPESLRWLSSASRPSSSASLRSLRVADAGSSASTCGSLHSSRNATSCWRSTA